MASSSSVLFQPAPPRRQASKSRRYSLTGGEARTTAHDPITAHKGPRPTHFLYWVVRRNFTTDTSKLQHWHCRILVATTLLMTDAMCNLAQASQDQGSCGNGRRTDCTGLYVFFNFWIRVLAKIALYEKITRRTFVCSYWITDFTHAPTRASPPHVGLALSLAYTWYKILRETGLVLPPKNLVRDLLVVS